MKTTTILPITASERLLGEAMMERGEARTTLAAILKLRRLKKTKTRNA